MYTGKEEGVLIACGGFTGGYTIFIKNGRAYYDYNYYNGSYYTLESKPLTKGENTITFKFTRGEPSEQGYPAGHAELWVNGEQQATASFPEMHISTFSLSETFDVGMDAGTPVSNKYRVKIQLSVHGRPGPRYREADG